MDNKQKGRNGLLLGMSYFGRQGYTISLPINDTQWYDFVIEKDGKFKTVQCKYTDSKDNTIDFRSTGGTKGEVFDNALNYPIDYFFCANPKCGFVIPKKDLVEKEVKRSITLLEEKSKFASHGFETYNYLVERY